MRTSNAIPRIAPDDYVISALESLGQPRIEDEQVARLKTALQMQMAGYQFSSPVEPTDEENTYVGRVLSPEKLIRFLANPGLFVTPPRNYDDPYEGVFPSDVVVAHKKGLEKHIIENMDISHASLFKVFVNQVFSSASGIEFPSGSASCWTLMEPHGASDLMWRSYAGGRNGVGIATTYGRLKSIFYDLVDEGDGQKHMISGMVEYTFDATRWHPAFRKRPQFFPEREVRFFFPEFSESAMLQFGCESDSAFETFYSEDTDAGFEMHAQELIDRHCANLFCS